MVTKGRHVDVATTANGHAVQSVPCLPAIRERTDMVQLQSARLAALPTSPLIPVKNKHSERRIARRCAELMPTAHATNERGARAGEEAALRPAATARIAAAAASSRLRLRRPPSTPFASFELPLGSETTRAEDMALVRSRLSPGRTSSLRHASLNSRTSAAPSR